jgi:hypothetical protein
LPWRAIARVSAGACRAAGQRAADAATGAEGAAMSTEQLELFPFTRPSFKGDAEDPRSELCKLITRGHRKKLEWEQEIAFWQDVENLRYRCDGEHKEDRKRWVKAALGWTWWDNASLDCLDRDRRFQRWIIHGLLLSWLQEMTGEADNEYTPTVTEDERCRGFSNAIAKLKRAEFHLVP